MKTRVTGFQLRPPAPSVSGLSLATVAERAGVSRSDIEQLARTAFLEPTYSLAEVAEHFGCSKDQVLKLVQFGVVHGPKLHPTRGGLYPTFKPSHKSRRIPLSAIERHKAHMARVHDHVAA